MSTWTEQAVQRLRSINWQASFDENRQGSAIALFREYARRMALWADQLNAGSRWPFFGVVEILVPGFSSRTCDEVVAELQIGTILTEKMARWYLQWAIHSDHFSGQQIPTPLPAPYDPIPLLFERGCLHLRPENNMLFVGFAGIALQPWRGYVRQEPFTTLETEQLADLDRVYREEHSRRESE